VLLHVTLSPPGSLSTSVFTSLSLSATSLSASHLAIAAWMIFACNIVFCKADLINCDIVASRGALIVQIRLEAQNRVNKIYPALRHTEASYLAFSCSNGLLTARSAC
jgi:hypothetical protein